MEMPAWPYEPALALAERLSRFPRRPGLLVHALRWAAALVIRAWLRLYHRLTIVGRENLPAEGSFLLVANHASHLDALCLLSSLPLGKLHRAFPAAARDYFFVGVPRLLAATVVANALPFDRRADVRASLELCRGLLDRPGTVLVVFPEGTRSASGEVGPFKAGVGLLAAASGHPVVPCYVHGSSEAWPRGSWLPRPRRLRLIIGKPRVYVHLARTASSAHRISRELRHAVLALAAGARPPVPFAPRQELVA